MCQFFDVQVTSAGPGPNGILAQITVQGRIETTCTAVNVTVTNGQNVVIFQGPAALANPVNVINGVPVRAFSVAIDVTGFELTCNDRVGVTVTCAANANCTFTDTIAIDCKGPPPDVCPDSSVLAISLTQNGNPVDLGAPCITAGVYEATLNGVPPGATIAWFLTIGVPQSLGPQNPLTLTIPAGTTAGTLMAVVTVPNCPDIVASVVLPPRQTGVCPADATVELRQNGQAVADLGNLAGGTYEFVVLDPLGAGLIYTFFVDNVQQQTGAAPSFTLQLAAGGAQALVSVVVTGVPCCPPVTHALTLTPDGAPPVDPNPDPVDPDPVDPDPVDPDPVDDEDDDDGGGLSLCGFLYAAMMVFVFAFIALWIFSFATFPVSAAVWIALGAALGLVLIAMAALAFVCNFSACRRWRVLGWMFAWCAIGCMIAFAVSLFTVWALVVGALIAGLVAIIIGLIMANRGCDFLSLFEMP